MSLEILSICLPTSSLILMMNKKDTLFSFLSEEMEAEHLNNLPKMTKLMVNRKMYSDFYLER